MKKYYNEFRRTGISYIHRRKDRSEGKTRKKTLSATG
jgi:hypothetical protein